MKSTPPADWNGAIVRAWLESRIVAARANQAAAERKGREGQDDCDVAAAEEMVCAAFRARDSTNDRATLLAELKSFLERDDYIWRGVYNDDRFDRHVRTYIRKLAKMAKANAGFDNTARYQ